MPGIDNNTLLMLHGNEFVDVSPMKKKITNQGATISEETHFQGQKSFYFDGSTKAVQVEPPAYDFGAGDFTIDWWENCTTGVRFSTNYSLEEGGILLGYDGKALYIGEPGKWEIFYNQTAFNVTPGQWVHWAFVRNGSTFTSYRNGKRFWSGTSDKRIYFDATDIWSIGNYRPDGISAFKGYIQEFRVSNIARWTSDFEPPTEPYSPENVIEVTLPRENGRTTYCRQFTYNPKGEHNSRRDGAIVSGMPVAGLLVSDLEDGTLISIPENGSPVLFYKAKSDYESALNGAGRSLVVRKDCYDNRVWDKGNVNAYASSDLDSRFNSTYKNMLDADIRSLIGTTKIRYTPGNGNNTVSTLERAIFALSLTELGKSHFYANTEGSALPIASTLRIAYRNGSATTQWTRSPHTNSASNAWWLGSDGGIYGSRCSYSYGSRPCFTLPATAMVDPTPNPDGSYNLIY